MPTSTTHSPRCAAILGPYNAGKTTLFESLLVATQALHRKGSVRDGTSLGDNHPESRKRQMSIEMTLAHTRYLDEDWHFIDCPGSVDFAQDGREAAMICDVAVVVVDPDPSRITMAAPILKYLDRNRIPHVIFINKVDHAGIRIRNCLASLQAVCSHPLVLREIPLRNTENDEEITGFVDLVSERAYQYQEGQPSQLIRLPGTASDREAEAREELLEALADFDDDLLEQILEDQKPAPETVYDNLERDLARDLIVPVFFGSAEHDRGIRRLLKALRHEAPDSAVAAHRLGISPNETAPAIQLFKTMHLPHAGRFCCGRVFSGTVHPADTLGGEHMSGLCRVFGDRHDKITEAITGEVIGLPRMEQAGTGQLLSDQGKPADGLWPDPLPPLYEIALEVTKPGDDVKLNEALRHMCEQDRSLQIAHNADTGQLVLRGQGDIHLQVVLAHLQERYHLDVATSPVATGYQETIRKPSNAQGRYKKQTGGHGQFGDVKISVRPLPRGEGFVFEDRIVGGAIPRQYIPAVEKGVRDAMRQGPLGALVVDIAVELTDGAHHAVDSSDQAFQMAGRLAIQEALKQGGPVLLEPIDTVIVSIPSEFTSRAQRLVSARRGQILGFSAKEGWQGWDDIETRMPSAETADMVTELRSITLGTGFFVRQFSHMQELTGKAAENALQSTRENGNK